MKNTVVLSTLIIIEMLTLMILSTIYGRLDRMMELESNLSSVVEETLEDMVSHSFYDYENMDDLMGEFAKSLFVTMDASSNVTIDVLQYDMQKGILSVRVTLFYEHPNGEVGRIVCEKHVIWNQLVKEEVIR